VGVQAELSLARRCYLISRSNWSREASRAMAMHFLCSAVLEEGVSGFKRALDAQPSSPSSLLSSSVSPP
jgi:hypothetical protein